ncbi:hypothetical protein DPMN_154064 [Dreissena polymorpha]|uniref:Uncharacterized protein n=1 Tax=Dreissena polymorpha TaxID=45954 RepID=A0A9D4FLX0_DREPO|nr:hypothetical protein DPMN_154064 [Dreissena polymorpha]
MSVQHIKGRCTYNEGMLMKLGYECTSYHRDVYSNEGMLMKLGYECTAFQREVYLQ